MTKKKTKSVRSTRGRGGKRGPGTMRIKVARVVRNREATLRRQGNNGDIYEDMMLYVKDQPVPRKRGRPRKSLQHMPMRRPVTHSSEVLYVPSLKQGCEQLVPVFSQCAMRRVMHGVGNNQQLKCIPSTVMPVKRKIGVDSFKVKQAEVKLYWPEDLRELLDTWNKLPENDTREVVQWLLTPLQSSNLPPVVLKLHSLITDWDITLDSKIDQICFWLQERPAAFTKCKTAASKQTTPSVPKVVVEAQPTAIDNFEQWSSMTDNQENLTP